MLDRLSLNGNWKFYPAFDNFTGDLGWMIPDQAGLSPGDRVAGWKARGFDDSGWLDVEVPGSWNTCVKDLWSYEGFGWYRRSISLPQDWRGRRIEFFSEGANYQTEVFVNGTSAGIHEGGHIPFSIPIHSLLEHDGGDVIAVACDNIPKPGRVPGGQFGWWNHGGLYRDVCLRTTDLVYIENARTRTGLGKNLAELGIDVELRSELEVESRRTLRAVLAGPDGQTQYQAVDEDVKVPPSTSRRNLIIRVEEPLLWSPEEPNLYSLSLELIIGGEITDGWSHRIGLRTLEVRGTSLLLNGRPLLIKGLNRHEEYLHGDLTTPTHTDEQLVEDLDLVKGLGANALRCHYPNHGRLYELCDEMGIINMLEVPLWQWGSRAVETDDTDALGVAREMLREMVRTYCNHACVLIWSVSNEDFVLPRSEDESEMARCVVEGNRELVSLARELDPTRPVVEVSNHWPEDPVLGSTDLLAINVYTGSPTPPLSSNVKDSYAAIHEKLERLREKYPGKPILVTEFGKWTVGGLMTDYPPGEIYQAEKFRAEWKGFLDEPCFVGGFIWCFADYDVHRRYRWVDEHRLGYGIFDLKRNPKAVVKTVRDLWREE